MDRGRERLRLESRLCAAVKDGDPRSVQMLLSQGASASVVGSKGVAALHLAVGKETEKSVRCLELLLQYRADPNVRSSEGLTPLHVAALWGCYQNVKLLLANGGDPNATDQDGNTPAQLAEQQDNHKCAKLLQNHRAQSDGQKEDLPLPQYSLYSDQTDISSYPDSDSSRSSRVSMISDCGGDLLSSTRHSALFDRPSSRPHPWWGGAPLNGHADVHRGGGGLGRDWDKHTDWLGGDGPSFLSSTRVSTVGPSLLSSTRVSTVGCPSARPLHQEDVTLGDTAWAPPDPEGPSLLSSTRVSTVGPALLSSTRVSSVEPVLLDGPPAEHNIVAPIPGVSSRPPGLERRPSALDGDAPAAAGPSRRASRKSVSFRGVDEYFPVFRPESARTPVVTAPFDSSQCLDFGSSDRLVTVLHRQGIDVTSPDHVHVFDWDSSLNMEGDMEKTVISNFRLKGGEDTETEEEEEEEEEKEVEGGQTRPPEQPPGGVAGSDSSGSHYSSCDSDHYTTAHYTTAQAGLAPAGRSSSSSSSEEAAKAGAPRWDARHPTDVVPRSPDVGVLAQDRWQDVAVRVGGLTLSDRPSTTDSAPEPRGDLSAEIAVDTLNEADDDVAGEVGPAGRSARGSWVDPDLPFTPSPYVTGRTRSRLSRCSARIGSTQDSLSSSSVTSLFEQTLPMPVRSHRKTLRSQGSDDVFHSPHARGEADARPTGGDSEMPSSSELSDSQADTFILPRGGAESGPPSPGLPDTIILERIPDSPTCPRQEDLEDLATERVGSTGEDFLTDDRTSSDQAEPRWKPRDGAVGTGRPGATWNKDGPWITEGSDTEVEPEPEPKPGSCSSSSLGSSSSSSCYFSPRRSRQDSSETAPCTLGTTGCTPRYSMSRLSLGVRRPRSHRALQDPPPAHTPGGRPAAPDPEEPVEYLYTDTERGHELIETRIPPTANTSVSASVSSGSSDPAADETVLYDWRSLSADVTGAGGGKENQKPQNRVEEEEEEGEAQLQLQLQRSTKKQQQQKKEGEAGKRQLEAEGGSALPDTRGMTDRELRRRLLDLGESPGPISARTRPVYVRRLCRLVQESAGPPGQQRQQRQQPEQQQADSGYSLELSKALRTFDLPDCHAAELELCQQFDQPDQNKKWREGVIKSSFNYLLLDPRVTKNLPSRSRAMSPHECFQTFVRAVFYVGKGKRARPYSHLYEALEYFKGDKTSKKLCSKVQHILQVWGGGQGVISLHCFQNVIPVEAFTREACMVDCIGLKMLTNKKRGDYYGVVSTWQARKRRELGVHLLYRAMQIFLAEGERQLRPADIRQ